MLGTALTPLSTLLLTASERLIQEMPIAPGPLLVVISGGQDFRPIFVESTGNLQRWLLDLAVGYGKSPLFSRRETPCINDSRGYALGISFSKQSATNRAAHPRRVSELLEVNIRHQLIANVRDVLGGEGEFSNEVTQGSTRLLLVILAFPRRLSKPSIFGQEFYPRMISNCPRPAMRFKSLSTVTLATWQVDSWCVLE